MRIFVESNFVLELAFWQQEHSACQRLLQSVEEGKHTLYVPDYSLTEVFQTLRPRRAQRQEVERYIQQEVKQHLREKEAVPADMSTLLRLLGDLLLTRTTSQTANLFAVAEKLARVATMIPLTSAVVRSASLAQTRHQLTPQDALVYASVHSVLIIDPKEPGLFVSRNESDFKKPDLLSEMSALHCDYLSSFDAAVGRLKL